jgi:hypothetical protein
MQYSILASALPRPKDMVGSAPAPSAPPADATTAKTRLRVRQHFRAGSAEDPLRVLCGRDDDAGTTAKTSTVH